MTQGPRNNWWSDSPENLWLDSDGHLHLRITQSKRPRYNGQRIWYSVGIAAEGQFGYGKYIFTLETDFPKLDRNAVVGLFTWDNTVPVQTREQAPYFREIDIELSRWGDPYREPAHYAIPPYEPEPHLVHKFAPDANKLRSFDYVSTHTFEWKPDKIIFTSFYGKDENPQTRFAHWVFDDKNFIQKPGNAKPLINLWLLDTDWDGDGKKDYGLNSPAQNKPVEVIVQNFRFIPE